nr:MAG TPA: hypothetical protein [Caudoviricetes sp.]
MENLKFFANPAESLAELPADAVNISAPTRRAAAEILREMTYECTDYLINVAFFEYVVSDVFARYQPAAGTPADPTLTPGYLYCYRNQAQLERFLDTYAMLFDWEEAGEEEKIADLYRVVGN